MALGLPKVPVTAEEFHARWLQSDGGKTLEKARLSFFLCLVLPTAVTLRLTDRRIEHEKRIFFCAYSFLETDEYR